MEQILSGVFHNANQVGKLESASYLLPAWVRSISIEIELADTIKETPGYYFSLNFWITLPTDEKIYFGGQTWDSGPSIGRDGSINPNPKLTVEPLDEYAGTCEISVEIDTNADLNFSGTAILSDQAGYIATPDDHHSIAYVGAFGFAQTTNGSSLTTPSRTTTSGNSIIPIASNWRATQTGYSNLTDNKSNSYGIAQQIIGNQDNGIGYSHDITGGTGHTVTWTFGTGSWGRINALEYSGMADAPLPEDTNYNNEGSVDPVTVATSASVKSGSLCIAIASNDGSDTNYAVDEINGWSSVAEQPDSSSGQPLLCQNKTSSGATETATFSTTPETGLTYTLFIATFYASETIFDVDHESGVAATEYPAGTVTNSGDWSIGAAGALHGSYGCINLLNDNNQQYGVVQLASPDLTGVFSVRCYIDTNGISASNTGELQVVNITDNVGNSLGSIILYWDYGGSGREVCFTVGRDSGGSEHDYFTISDGLHYFELKVKSATTSSSSDGYGRFWIDGSEQTARTGVDNYDRFANIDYLSVGCTIKTGTWSGTFYVDDIIANNGGVYIGPVAGGTTEYQSVSGAITPSGIVTGKAEKLLVGASTFTGSLYKKVSYSLLGALSFVGEIYKKAYESLVGAFTSSGDLVGEKVSAYQYARPNSDISINNWLPSSGADLYAMLDEVTPSGADFVRANRPSSEVFEVQLSSVTDPATGLNHRVNYQVNAYEGTVNFTFYLMEGATQRATWNENGVTGQINNYYDLSESEANSITSYSNLRIRVEATMV